MCADRDPVTIDSAGVAAADSALPSPVFLSKIAVMNLLTRAGSSGRSGSSGGSATRNAAGSRGALRGLERVMGTESKPR